MHELRHNDLIWHGLTAVIGQEMTTYDGLRCILCMISGDGSFLAGRPLLKDTDYNLTDMSRVKITFLL